MAKTFVRLEGFEQLVKDLEKAGDSIEKDLVDGVEAAAEIVEANMEKRLSKLPYATGETAMNTNIVNTFRDDASVTALVGPGSKVDHAFFAEVGVRGNKKKTRRQFARPAVDKNKKKIREAISEAVGKAFERAVRR